MEPCQLNQKQLDLIESQHARPNQNGGYAQMFYELIAHIKYQDELIKMLSSSPATTAAEKEAMPDLAGEVDIPPDIPPPPKSAASAVGPVTPKKAGKSRRPQPGMIG